MICRRINLFKAFVLVLFLSLFYQDVLASCKLEETPLMYERRCNDFKKADQQLNTSYGKLMDRLSKDQKFKLRSAQRRWIEWRDKKCEELESYCVTGSCSGVAHDSCVIDLTKIRDRELRSYYMNVEDAEQRNFAFSMDYPKTVPFSNAR